MLQAEIAKLRSNCITRHIGAVIVKENRQIATGYNGTPSGIKNCFEGGCLRCMSRARGEIKSGERLDRCLCSHAEANAIMQCALFGNAGSTKSEPHVFYILPLHRMQQNDYQRWYYTDSYIDRLSRRWNTTPK